MENTTQQTPSEPKNKTLMIVIGIIVIVLALIAIVAMSGKKQQPMVGNDRDLHGCIGSAGYTWSEEKQACIRPWEQTAQDAQVEQIKVQDSSDELSSIEKDLASTNIDSLDK